MIFAAGFGTRMAHLNQDVPKPMVPFAGRPMIDRTIDLVRAAGIETVVANTHHMHDRIAPHLVSQGVSVSHEHDKILDTGGGLRKALPLLGKGPVLTINPDALWLGPNPIRSLLDAWNPDMRALLMLVPMDKVHGSNGIGDFSLEHGEIRRSGPFRYGGAQIIRPDHLDGIEGDVFSLNAYWDLLADQGQLKGAIYDGDWCDIGTPKGLEIAEAMLSDV
ncbi:MAG: nucleotidyltransferase family protein [Silicimonas sp.]|nr:nucleotidyltransferase family protein [Silicimonas sp.]